MGLFDKYKAVDNSEFNRILSELITHPKNAELQLQPKSIFAEFKGEEFSGTVEGHNPKVDVKISENHIHIVAQKGRHLLFAVKGGPNPRTFVQQEGRRPVFVFTLKHGKAEIYT